MFKDKLSLVPEKPGCYLMKDKDSHIIYVGKAKNLKRRVSSYFNRVQTGKTLALVSNIDDFEYIVTNTNTECLILEINLIKKYNPKYNILLKDDKTYPYIAITGGNKPSLRIIRSKTRKKVKDRLFGPYPNVTSARETVNILNRIYPLAKCNNLKKDVCLYYHIGQCLGYCKYDVSKDKINQMIKEITSILNGDYKLVTKKLEEAMEKASIALNYEEALELKNMIESIKITLSKQVIVSSIKHNFDVFGLYEKDNFLTIETLLIRDGVITGKISKIFDNYIDMEDVYERYLSFFYERYPLPKEIVINDVINKDDIETLLGVKVIIPSRGDVKKILNMANLNAEITAKNKVQTIAKSNSCRMDALNLFKKILKLGKLERIEIFDNSHLFGTYYVGGMVVFDDFLPNRKEYRKYKIDTLVKDDLSAMKEVIYRRYFRVLLDKLVVPDLIIVDGGETQVKVALSVLDDLNLKIKVVGLKKDEHHRTAILVDSNLQEVLINDNTLFLYLMKMQDEVHRFAITYHRDIKSKGALASVLENVSGIGKKRRVELLKHFGSIKKIKEASIDDLSSYLPIDVAKALKDYLKE